MKIMKMHRRKMKKWKTKITQSSPKAPLSSITSRKTIKKKIGGGFSKSRKLLPYHRPMNDLPAYYLLGGGLNYVKDSKKACQQANLVRMDKDSLMSEKEWRRQDRLTSNNLTQKFAVVKEAQQMGWKLFEVIKCQ
jgi:hypothetical protein